MKSRDSWENLMRDWQAGSPSFDIAALRKRADRKRRRMLIFTALDFIAAPIFTVLLVWVGVHSRFGDGSPAPWLLIALVWVATLVPAWLRFSTLNADTMGAVGMLRLTIKRARTGMHFVWIVPLLLFFAYAIMTPMFSQMWTQGDAAQQRAVVRSMVANSVVCGAVIIWAIWYGRRQWRKLRQAQALLKQWEQDIGDDQ